MKFCFYIEALINPIEVNMRFKLTEWFLIVSTFILFFYLYSLYSYIGIQDFVKDGVLKAYFETNAWHLEIILTGILFGSLFILINRLTENRFIRKRSFGFNILLRSILYIVALSLIGLALYKLFSLWGLIDSEMQENLKSFLSLRLIASFLSYWLMFVLLTNFIISISNKFGPRTMVELLTGKYYHPRDEELVFMFLDLKDSTRIAEKLGNNVYSRFIKECIHELTPVILKHKARIYQYVGDEVVLYWKVNDGFKNFCCINTFFDFSEKLKSKEELFLSKFGESPKYKAGMDAGLVTLTEIGDVKREIAFHGDVLNTAARLEAKCNDYNEQLIVSENIIKHLEGERYQIDFLSDLPLRGKVNNIRFYSVNIP